LSAVGIKPRASALLSGPPGCGKMSVWPWPDAADAFCERLTRYIPQFQSPTRRKARRQAAA